MLIFYIIFFIVINIMLYVVYNFSLIKRVYLSHKFAHLEKYSNNGKFNEAYNLVSDPSDEKTHHLRPIINLDNEKIRTIIFMNNINSITLTADQRLAFDLNLISKDHTSYYFLTDNYNVSSDQSITQNIMSNNFPKLYENDTEHYNTVSLRDLGYPLDVKIKTDDIVCMVFNGKIRMVVIITNDRYQSGYYIKYKNKKEMISIIKNTPLYAHIMQWGLPGFSDSQLTYIQDSSVNNTEPDVYKTIAKDIKARFPEGTETYIEERILE